MSLYPDRVVLLADDNHDDADFFRHALRTIGFENPLHILNSGEETIRYLAGEGHYEDRVLHPLPYLLVPDPNMPGKSGWQVLEWVRQQPEFKGLVVILLGGTGSPSEEQMATRLGANGYHGKPQTHDELRALVRRIGEFWLAGGDLSSG
jgi:CheY-like chemotaxis protein